MERLYKKLNNVRLGLNLVVKSLNTLYKLRLSTLAYIYNIFSLNRLTKANPELPLLSKQINEPLLPIVVNKEEEQEVDDVLDSRYYYSRLQYKVKQNSINRDNIQYYIDGEKFKNLVDIVDTYYKRYPRRPSLAYTKPKQVGSSK